MKRIVYSVLFLVAIALGLNGCAPANRTNVGALELDGDWIYYVNLDEEALYKVKKDWSEKTKLTDNFATGYLQIEDDAIYYFGNEGDIFKIQTDGQNPTKLIDVEEGSMPIFQVADDWVYYSLKSGGFYKTATDGSETLKIADLKAANGNWIVADDWLYYETDNGLAKLKADGTGADSLATNIGIYAVDGDWIYYGDRSEKSTLSNIYRMTLDGERQTKISDGAFVDIADNSLYYLQEDGLYKAGLDGLSAQKQNEVDMWNIYGVDGDYIYYSQYSGGAYRMKLDGTDVVPIP